MTYNLTPLIYTGAGSNTFNQMANLVNQLVAVLANQTLTSNTIVGGAMSAGNGFNIGIFGSNTLVATTLQGGNVLTTTAISLGSNLIGTGFTTIIGNVVANSTVITIGANVFANTTGFWTGNSQVNSTLNSVSLTIGSNSVVNTSMHYVGTAGSNSYINALAVVSPNGIFGVLSVANSSGFYYNGLPIGSGGSAPGGANTNVQYSNSGVLGGSAGLSFNYVTGALTLGANVTVNTSQYYVGNSWSNSYVNALAVVSPNGIFGVLSVANSSGFYYNGSLLTTSAPGTPNTAIQYANAGAFTGSGNLTFNWTSTTLTVGNTTNNTAITPAQVYFGNSTTNGVANSTTLAVANSTSTATLTPLSYSFGNSTANISANSIIKIVANSTAQTVVTPVSVSFGNSTANAFVNSTIEIVANSTATVVTPVSVSFGNSTANAFVNSTIETIAIATSKTVVNATTLTVGNTVANAFVNSTCIALGNSLSNSTINSSGFFYDGAPLSTSIGGANTQVIFNDSGSSNGSSAFTYNKGTTVVAANVVAANAFNSVKNTLTFGTTTNWNLALGTVAQLTLTANTTMAAPTNMAVSSYMLLVYQDNNVLSHKITWDTTFKWPGKTPPTLTGTQNALDVFWFVSDGSNMYGSVINNVG